jgi:hypothetical protein
VGNPGVSSLQLLDVTTGSLVNSQLTSTGYNSSSGTETFTFANGLDAGICHANLPAGSFYDADGNASAAAAAYTFLYVPDDGLLVLMPGSGAIGADQLSIGSEGTLDVTDNTLRLTSGDIKGITSLLTSGPNSGAGYWKGSGILSSTAAADTTFLTSLGVLQAAADTTLDGLTLYAGNVLIKYTYYGDANLDAKVDGSDYSLIDNGSLNHLTSWFNGDFNYDGVVNGSDYTLIDNAFNSQGASLAAAVAPMARKAAASGVWARPTTLFSDAQAIIPSQDGAAVNNIAAGFFAGDFSDPIYRQRSSRHLIVS